MKVDNTFMCQKELVIKCVSSQSVTEYFMPIWIMCSLNQLTQQ